MTSPSDIPQIPAFPTPVTFDRLLTLAREQGFLVNDREQRFAQRWDQTVLRIWIPENRELLLCHATQPGVMLPASRRTSMLAFANDWHRDRLWPMVVVADTEQGLQMHAQMAIDIGAGMTDDQLRTNLSMAQATIRQAVSAFNHTFRIAPPEGSAAAQDGQP
ncbi:MAG: YbjN domain-containing protein [Beutenbergiaceae bacterium]